MGSSRKRRSVGIMGGEGGFGKGGGFGDKGKGKGKDKGKGKKGKKGKKGAEEKEWVPVTKLGRLVKDGKIGSIEDIYLHSLPIKEFQIIDQFFAPGTLKDEVMKIHPVQKMTSAGQRNRFVCYVLVGDSNGHIGLGQKCAKEVATAIRGGIIAAKMNLIPVRRGYWGNRIGFPHTVPMKVHGKSGTSREQRRRFAHAEEDAGVRGHCGLLLRLLRPHEDQGQLHEGDVRRARCHLQLPHPGPVEGDPPREVALPGMVGLARAVEGRARHHGVRAAPVLCLESRSA